jgi:hypothetical protein
LCYVRLGVGCDCSSFQLFELGGCKGGNRVLALWGNRGGKGLDGFGKRVGRDGTKGRRMRAGNKGFVWMEEG